MIVYFLSAIVRNVFFKVPPQTLNFLGVCLRDWVNKIDGVVDFQMLITWVVQTVIRSPAIGDDGGPGSVLVLDRCSRVSFDLSSTGTMKKSPVSRSMPPNTHWPSIIRTQLFFLQPIFFSSSSHQRLRVHIYEFLKFVGVKVGVASFFWVNR